VSKTDNKEEKPSKSAHQKAPSYLMSKKYIVSLTPEEGRILEHLTNKGKSPADRPVSLSHYRFKLISVEEK
jgi:hypothetical protein